VPDTPPGPVGPRPGGWVERGQQISRFASNGLKPGRNYKFLILREHAQAKNIGDRINLDDLSIKQLANLIGREPDDVRVEGKRVVCLFANGADADVRVHIKKIEAQALQKPARMSRTRSTRALPDQAHSRARL